MYCILVKQVQHLDIYGSRVGVSVAFDLATQCGYSSDEDIARPEIGKVGVPINTLDDFAILFDEMAMDEINTSMTINGTSMWLLSLYIALAQERGIELAKLHQPGQVITIRVGDKNVFDLA